MNGPLTYPGEELELFRYASHWKNYFAAALRPYIRGHVLEAGAGIGSTTPVLYNPSVADWLLLEPDPAMEKILSEKCRNGELPAHCRVQGGTLENLDGLFDTIIYIDVLEHIENDVQELSLAAAHLQPGGHILAVSPAFPMLYSPFDKAIGHYRRYTRKLYRHISPAGTRLILNRYYDSAGFFASLANKAFLKQKDPTLKQVLFWDKWLVPLSRFSDKLVFHAFGRSITGIWEKTAG